MPQMLSKSKAHSSIRLMHKPNIHWFLTMVWRVLTELEQIRLVWTTGIRFFLILRVTEEMSGATRVSPFNSTEVRGEQLAQQVEEIIAITGKPKVNLIGHSHGGPTIRYVAGIMPEKVASLTTIGAPHKGSPMADVILNVEGTPLSGLATLVNWFSAAITWAGGLDPNSYPHDSLAGAHSLSTQGSAQFNAQFPMGVPTTSCGEGAYQEKGIYMYSFSGNKALTNPLDPFDMALTGSSLVVDPFGDNDGLVSRCSAKFGKTIRDDYNWNHLDEVNQVMGIRSIFAADPVSVYRQHANRLKLQGL